MGKHHADLPASSAGPSPGAWHVCTRGMEPTLSGWGPHLSFFFFFFKLFIYLFIYLFLAVLGLCFCARAFSSCGKRGPLFITERGPLTVAVSLVAERRLSRCGSWA